MNDVLFEPLLFLLGRILAKDKNVRLVIIDLNIEIDTAVDAAVVGVTAGKFVVVRPSAVRKAADFPSKLWEHTHILAANDFEAPILLGTQPLTPFLTVSPFDPCFKGVSSCVARPSLRSNSLLNDGIMGFGYSVIMFQLLLSKRLSNVTLLVVPLC